MIAVTIPAHNEADLIGKCLQSILAAAAHPHLAGERVEIHVALDRCSDGTGTIARAHGARTVTTSGGVGVRVQRPHRRRLRAGRAGLRLPMPTPAYRRTGFRHSSIALRMCSVAWWR